MRAHYKNISGGTGFIIGAEVDICLLLKVYFLRQGSRVHVFSVLQEALLSLPEIAPDFIIILSDSIEAEQAVVDILAQQPNVQLIILNNEVVYDKRLAQ